MSNETKKAAAMEKAANVNKTETLEEPSKEFLDSLARFGSNVVTCDFCNTTYFCTWSERDFEEGEVEQYRKKAQEDPKHYVEWSDCDSATYGAVDFRTFVIGCPCNMARRYENWIWAHRFIIADFLAAKAKGLLAKARLTQELADKAKMGADANV